MYNSPGTPMGAGRRSASSTRHTVLAIGRPMDTVLGSRAARSTRCTVDQIVVSVGPNMFHTGPQLSWRRRPRSVGIASPPQSTVSRRSPGQPASKSIDHVVGVACTTVAAEELISSASRRPSLASSRPATTRRPPATSGPNISSTEMSNDRVVSASSTSSAVSPGSSSIDCRRLTTLVCSTSTPFGTPVEPEV